MTEPEQPPENATGPCLACGHRQHSSSFTGRRVGRADPGAVEPYRAGGKWEPCYCALCQTEQLADVVDLDTRGT